MLMFGDVMEGRGRDNNFLIIRLLAATAVVAVSYTHLTLPTKRIV